VFAGQHGSDGPVASMLIGRVHSDGSFDASFGTNGMTITAQAAHLGSIARQPDGAIVGAGAQGQFDGVAVRYLGSRCDDVARTTCATVTATGRSRLQLRGGVTNAQDTLVWKWRKGDAPVADLGDPTTTTDYALCVYEASMGRLVYEESAYGGGTCRGRSCWRPGRAGFSYVDASGSVDGVTKVALKAGTGGKSTAMLKAKGARLTLPALPLPLPTRVQLQANNGTCFDTTFSSAGAATNTADRFVGKSD
jgi:hypothetical protein